MKQLFEKSNNIIEEALSINWQKIQKDYIGYFIAVVNRLESKPDNLKAQKVNAFDDSVVDVIRENLEKLERILIRISNNLEGFLKTFAVFTIPNLSTRQYFAAKLMSCLPALEEVKENIQDAFSVCMDPVPDYDEVNTPTNQARF